VVVSTVRVVSAGAAILAATAIAAAAVIVPSVSWQDLLQSRPALENPIVSEASLPPRDGSDESQSKIVEKFAQLAPTAPAPAPTAPTGPVPGRLPSAPLSPPPRSGSGRQADADLVVTLVSSVMLALHQANITGNYTVLRDMSAPGFRNKNTATDLGRIFAPIRETKIDLSQTVLLDPHITTATLNDQKMLYLVGAFDTKPTPVTFELLFEPIDGNWQMFGIAVKPVTQITDAPSGKPSLTGNQPGQGKRISR
jgi:hypothetical protein